MIGVLPRQDFLKRLLFLGLILIGLVSVWSSQLFSQWFLLAIPLSLLFCIALTIKPEIGIGLFIAGINFFGIVLTLLNFEKPILVYVGMSASVVFSTLYLVLTGRGKAPSRGNIIIYAVIYFAIVFYFNVFRTNFPYYTSVKSFVFGTAGFAPFFLVNLFSGDKEYLIKGYKSSVFVGLIPLIYSFAIFFALGHSGLLRFSPVEMVNLNIVARSTGFLAIIIAWYFFETDSFKLKWLLGFLFIGSIVLLILTGSRASFLATFGAIVVYVILFPGLKFSERILIGVLIIGLVILPVFFGLGAIFQRFTNLQYMDLSVAGRMGMWLATWQHKFDNILFGFGTGNFATILPAWAVGRGLRFPHNLFIEFYIEWGILGIIAFFLLFASPVIIWLRIQRSREYSEKIKRFSNLLITLIAFIFVNGLADVASSNPYLYFTLGSLSTIYSNTRK